MSEHKIIAGVKCVIKNASEAYKDVKPTKPSTLYPIKAFNKKKHGTR